MSDASLPVVTAEVRRRTTRILALLLGAALLLAIAGVVLWRVIPDAPAPPPLPGRELPLAGATPVPVFALEDAEPMTDRQAERWLPGTRLLNASMQVDWPWFVDPDDRSLPATGWITAVYLAPWQQPFTGKQAASLSLVVERLSGQIVLQTALGWETAPPMPSVTPAPAIDSRTASLLAEDAAGRQFRGACPAQRHTSRISLSRAAGLPEHWLVTYDDTRDPAAAGLLVRVDAATGEILHKRESAPACPGLAPAPTPSAIVLPKHRQTVGSVVRSPEDQG